MTIGLRVSVQTIFGALQGVPRLIKLLDKYSAKATFFFAMGPDTNGLSIKQLRQSLSLRYFNYKSINYRAILRLQTFETDCKDILKLTRNNGFEIGVDRFNSTSWKNNARSASSKWTELQMQRTNSIFIELSGKAPKASSAPFWQMNRDAYRLNQRLGYAYTSDTRGTHPFLPIFDGEIISCPQVPTTLPTIPEMMQGKRKEPNLVLQSTIEHMNGLNHLIYGAHAEMEGGPYYSHFDKLLQNWSEKKHDIVSLQQYLERSVENLPRHNIITRKIPGFINPLAYQGPEFLG